MLVNLPIKIRSYYHLSDRNIDVIVVKTGRFRSLSVVRAECRPNTSSCPGRHAPYAPILRPDSCFPRQADQATLAPAAVPPYSLSSAAVQTPAVEISGASGLLAPTVVLATMTDYRRIKIVCFFRLLRLSRSTGGEGFRFAFARLAPVQLSAGQRWIEVACEVNMEVNGGGEIGGTSTTRTDRTTHSRTFTSERMEGWQGRREGQPSTSPPPPPPAAMYGTGAEVN